MKANVNDGDKIADEFVKGMLKIDGFKLSRENFVFNIKNADETNWNKFKTTISNITSQIREKGLKE